MTSNLKMELRWLVKDNARVLQYRQQQLVPQYSMFDEKTGNHIKLPEWGNWEDVPEHKETA